MIIELVYPKEFLKAVQKLPKAQQEKLATLLETLQVQPFAPILHTKPLSGELTGFFSFRITRNYRIIFQFLDPTTIKLIDAAHRKEIYR